MYTAPEIERNMMDKVKREERKNKTKINKEC